ncbi:hypothetical protein B0J14DRAFT_164865 [Halenospora varia]|nr:hypothetical protein B0J14DRAFT_164865 [Halenospora varia]
MDSITVEDPNSLSLTPAEKRTIQNRLNKRKSRERKRPGVSNTNSQSTSPARSTRAARGSRSSRDIYEVPRSPQEPPARLDEHTNLVGVVHIRPDQRTISGQTVEHEYGPTSHTHPQQRYHCENETLERPDLIDHPGRQEGSADTIAITSDVGPRPGTNASGSPLGTNEGQISTRMESSIASIEVRMEGESAADTDDRGSDSMNGRPVNGTAPNLAPTLPRAHTVPPMQIQFVVGQPVADSPPFRDNHLSTESASSAEPTQRNTIRTPESTRPSLPSAQKIIQTTSVHEEAIPKTNIRTSGNSLSIGSLVSTQPTEHSSIRPQQYATSPERNSQASAWNSTVNSEATVGTHPQTWHDLQIALSALSQYIALFQEPVNLLQGGINNLQAQSESNLNDKRGLADENNQLRAALQESTTQNAFLQAENVELKAKVVDLSRAAEENSKETARLITRVREFEEMLRQFRRLSSTFDLESDGPGQVSHFTSSRVN